MTGAPDLEQGGGLPGASGDGDDEVRPCGDGLVAAEIIRARTFLARVSMVGVRTVTDREW